MVRELHFVVLICLFTQFGGSQGAEPATIAFTLDFPGSQPGHYSLRVERNGAAQYESTSKLSADSEEEDSFTHDFTATEEMRRKIFGLAAKAGYFQQDLDSHRKNMAFTGKKTLSYKDGQRHGEATYNYSANAAVQELTTIFQSVSATLEYGHRLEYARRYQKLALAEELKHMEESARSSPLLEIQAIAPILQQIVDDPGVINVSRARAQRLLQSGQTYGQ